MPENLALSIYQFSADQPKGGTFCQAAFMGGDSRLPLCLVVSLFFDFSYKLVGEKDMNEANRVMDKFSRAAEKAKDEFRS